MKVFNLEQKSEGWLRWRAAGVGGSDAPVIWFGKHFRRTVKDLWREKREHFLKGAKGTERKEDPKSISAMARGTRLEPLARGMYEQLVGYRADPVCGVHDVHPWMKASLDGWIDEAGVVVEIKAPNRDDHQCALDGAPPEKYLPQLDHLLGVSEGKFAHYVSYSNYCQGTNQLAVVIYYRDDKRIQELISREAEFWDMVQDGVEPPS